MKLNDFCLLNQNGDEVKLSDYSDKKLVLFAYPKASTPGCTTETREFTENYENFKKLGFEIIGFSKDTVKRQSNFAKKLDTTFSLLSDEEGALCEELGIWQLKKMAGREYMGIVRSTFILNEEREVIKEWRKVRVKGHVQEVLEFCSNLEEGE